MKRCFLPVLAATQLLAPIPVMAADVKDPCAVSPKSVVAIGVTAATTTVLIASSTGVQVNVCAIVVSNLNTATNSGSFQFLQGASATCSGAVTLSGALGAGNTTAGTPTPYVAGNGAGTLFVAPPNKQLCIATVGSSVNVQGFLSYVAN